jgi:hypothetical protein
MAIRSYRRVSLVRFEQSPFSDPIAKSIEKPLVWARGSREPVTVTG